MASGELELIISAIIFSYTWTLILPHTNCVTLGKSLHLSGLHFLIGTRRKGGLDTMYSSAPSTPTPTVP